MTRWLTRKAARWLAKRPRRDRKAGMIYAHTSVERWGLLSDKTNRLDGRTVHLIYEN